MPVSLTTAAPGDRFEARDGVWIYDGVTAEWWNGEMTYRFHRYDGVSSFFTEAGLHVGGDGNDLIRALDSPAPAPAEPMGDAGLVGEFGQAKDDAELLAWLNDQHARLVAQFPDIEYIAGSDDTIYSVAATRLATLSADNEALRRDLEEARASAFDEAAKMIENRLGVSSIAKQLIGALRAARDWHSKHGDGDAR